MWRRLKRKFGQALSAKASSGAARESTTTLGGMFGEQTSRWHTGAAENATLERVGCIAPTSRTVADLDAMADALRCSEVFLRLEDELLDIVAAATTWEVLAPDEVICDEQSVDSTVLLVVRGKLSVLTRDRDSVAVYDLGPGDTFSDYSADSRRNVASVSASSDNVALLQLLIVTKVAAPRALASIPVVLGRCADAALTFATAIAFAALALAPLLTLTLRRWRRHTVQHGLGPPE